MRSYTHKNCRTASAPSRPVLTTLAFAIAGSLALSGCFGGGSDDDDDATNEPVTAKITLANGEVQGIVEEDTLIWHGLPYAKPPVGDLRWRAPQTTENWTGTRDATQRHSECVQAETTTRWQRTSTMVGDEDCLIADVYRPNRAGYQSEKLPVYVWIHGGSNNFGTAKQYDGRALVENSDVVMVVLQYRLGPLGWFFHPDVQTAGVDALSDSGNFGTLDTIEALKWIKANIADFGGDPDNVTITGESAGAHNVLNLLVSPEASGDLFQQAVSQSGAMTTRSTGSARTSSNSHIEWLIRLIEDRKTPATPIDAAQAKQMRLDMESAGTLNAYLRAAPGRDLYQAVFNYSQLGSYGGIEDGNVIPVGGWLPAFTSGEFNNVPVILGANEYEQKSFMPLYGGALKAAVGGTIPSVADKSWLDLLDVAFEGTQTLNDVLPTQKDKDTYEVTGYNGGRAWRAKYVDQLASVIAQHQPDTYAYDFRWGTQAGPQPFNFIYGAGHASEISFFHGTGEGLFNLPFTTQNEPGRQELQNAMMDYLADFARGGDPNGEFSKDELAWQPWTNTAGVEKVIVFDATDAASDISMSNETLTLDGVNTAWTTAMTTIGLTVTEQGRLRALFGQSASYSTP